MRMVEKLMERARAAQQVLEGYSQEQVDALARAIGKFVYDNAEDLARRAVEETGMGVYEDKAAKCRGKSKNIWYSLKGKRSVGVIEEDSKTGILKVAKPKGVVAAITPVTNPVVTPMCNAMFAFKGRNAIVIAPHPKAKKVNWYLVEQFRAIVQGLGAPADIIQTVEEPSVEFSSELMKAADTVIATGGAGMVKAAYSSGKPAMGVGPGNVQVILDRGIDQEAAVEKVIAGRIFDNGIICSGEQSVIVPREAYQDVMGLFVKNGVYYTEDPQELAAFREAIFPGGGAISREVVGQGVQTVARLAGVAVPEGTRMILLGVRDSGEKEVLCREKMCPVMAALPYDSFEDAVAIAKENLLMEGAGHTVSLHSEDMGHIRYAGEMLPVSRLIVNQPSSTNAGGSLQNGFSPTTTLGCGSWGNNSISENLTYTHLINISQIGLPRKDTENITDEEIWAESNTPQQATGHQTCSAAELRGI